MAFGCAVPNCFVDMGLACDAIANRSCKSWIRLFLFYFCLTFVTRAAAGALETFSGVTERNIIHEIVESAQLAHLPRIVAESAGIALKMLSIFGLFLTGLKLFDRTSKDVVRMPAEELA